MGLDDRVITRAIIERYTEKLLSCLEIDVAVVGAGPSGIVAAHDLAVTKDGVPDPRKYHLEIEGNFADSHSVTPSKAVFLVVAHERPAEYLSNVTDGWLGTHAEEMDFQFKYAGDYSIVLLGKDDDADVAKDSDAKWSNSVDGTLWIPACAHFVGSDYNDIDQDKFCDPGEELPPSGYCIGDCTTAYGELGKVEAVPPSLDLETFYSGRYPIGERGGVVEEGTSDNFLAACLEDSIVHFSGHGCADGIALRFERLVGEPPNQYTQSLEWFMSSDIVAGQFGQIRVAVLGACDTMANNDSIGHKFVTVGGAQSCVGYVGHIWFEAMAWVDGYGRQDGLGFWHYLAKEQYTVQGAANKARDDYGDWFGEEQEIASGVSGIHVAPSPCSTVIYPAF